MEFCQCVADLECGRDARESTPDIRKAKSSMSYARQSRPWSACVLSSILWMGTDGYGYGQPSAQLAGSVQDATGLPLAGVTLTLRGPSNKLTQTDPEGQFDFQSLPEGQYELTATLPGFAPARQIARLIAAQRSVVSLTLTVLVFEQTVVTAARTGEADVQTVPMAVSVLPGIQLARMQDHTVEDIAGRAPGVTFSQNTGRAQVTIRGIGTNAVAARVRSEFGAVSRWRLPGRPAMVLADFLDLDRVEVLRGPQGTLYGRNSLGGAINLVSRTPTSDKEASFRVGGRKRRHLSCRRACERSHHSWKAHGQRAILRGVRTGTVRDLNHPDHPLGGEDVIGARGQLRVVLNRRSELLVSADLNAQRSGAALLFEDPGGQAGVSGRQSRRIFTTCARRFPRRGARSSPARRPASRSTSRRQFERRA